MTTDSKKRDSTKWCAFHREHGHATEDCRVLKRKVEELLRRGYLRNLVADPNKWGPERPRSRSPRKSPPRINRTETEPRREDRRVIHSIHGGFACGGELRENRRAYAIEPIANIASVRTEGPDIIFTAEDANGACFPHEDALVVTLDVGNCTVKRILVDNGSSADIIFLSTIEAMGISPTAIQPTQATLVGFNGVDSKARGKITLPISVKDQVQMTELMVVDAPSAYNMIVGRPWLHSMKAVPSTYHQKLKYTTATGVDEIPGDQAVARVCYIKTLDGKMS